MEDVALASRWWRAAGGWVIVRAAGAVVLLLASVGRAKPALVAGHGVTATFDRYGVIRAVSTRGTVLLEKGLLEGVSLGQHAPHRTIRYFQTWSCMRDARAVTAALKRRNGFDVEGSLSQPGRASAPTVAFRERYVRVKAGAIAVHAVLRCDQAALWAEPLRLSFYLPVATFYGGVCRIENSDDLVTTYPITAKPLVRTNYFARAIWLRNAGREIKIVADRHSQLMLLDARAWKEQALIIRLSRRRPWRKQTPTPANYKVALDATMRFNSGPPHAAR